MPFTKPIFAMALSAAKNSGRDRWVGAFLKPDGDPEAIPALDAWTVAWAQERGLMEVCSSEADFVWPPS